MGRRFASDYEANLATKFDLSELRRDTKDDMRQVKDDMRQVGAAVDRLESKFDSKLDAALGGLKDEMKADRQAIEARLAAEARLAPGNCHILMKRSEICYKTRAIFAPDVT